MWHDRLTCKRSLAITASALVLAASLSACAAPASLASTLPDAVSSPSVSLLLQGYNYTDHYIDSFSVNGQGGGNIFESGPDSGGGKSACCLAWQPGSKLPVKVKVKWVAGYCTYIETNQYGRSRDRRRSLWKERDTLITEVVTDNPRALEVHFYQDGRIEAAVTQGDSPPRLKLPRDDNRNRPGVSQEFPRCLDDTK